MFSFLKWLSVIRPRAVTGHLHLSDTGLWMWERARITCQPWRKKESVKCKQSYRYFIEQNSDSCSTYCTCISLALELRHGGRDQGVCGLGSIITALSAAGARAGHLSWPLLMSVMRERGQLSPPPSLIPSSGLTPSAEWDWSLRDEDSWNTFPKWMGYIDRIKDWYTVYFIFVYIDKWIALQNSPWASLL